MAEPPLHERTLGLIGATSIGIGAIVGGGIFVLAGAAFAAAGPAAIIAFAINGVIALLTAMSFAEVSSAFPENGGAYTFAKKLMSVRAAFATGWLLWFAYIVAGALYALGFASFTALALEALWEAFGGIAPDWLSGRRLTLLFAAGATIIFSYSLIRKGGGGSNWATGGKLVVFVVLVVAGFVAVLGQGGDETSDAMTPFFAGGASGLVMAMGLTFIALQGFDLITAVGGEVKQPGRNIPKAMFLSLGCALLVYLPLLFVVVAAGTMPGESIQALAISSPESVIPVAASKFMGRTGYWLVLVAAVLSTLSALHANLLAASRVASAMAQDRTLPAILGDVHRKWRTPVMAISATALTLITIVFMVPDLGTAGGAASLIFLLVFAIAHIAAFLARRRGGTKDAPYRTPWFPIVPIVGGVACCALALFQVFVMPDAAGIVLLWLGLGGILYWSLFARGAEVVDAASEAHDPGLKMLRGQDSLVLVPIVNPAHALALMGIANALASRQFGRVLLLSIVPPRSGTEGITDGLENAKNIVAQSLQQSFDAGYMPEALITIASAPMDEIRRIADEHQCGCLLLGLGGQLDDASESELNTLIDLLAADVALIRSPPEWQLGNAKRVLVAVGGLGEQHELRARVLNSICRYQEREISFVTVVPQTASESEAEKIRKNVVDLGELQVRGEAMVKILRGDDPVAVLAAEAEHHDLMILGLQTGTRDAKPLGGIALRLAQQAPCATLLLCRQKSRSFVVPSWY